MPHIFYAKKTGDFVELDERETHHLKVVRHRVGDIIKVTDGKGVLYVCELVEVGKEKSIASIKQSNVMEAQQKEAITLCAASENWDRLRWLIEKSTEVGIDRIVIYKAKRSRSYVQKKDKIELIVREAAKQCERVLFPEVKVCDELDFKDLNGRTVILHKSGRPANIQDFQAPITIVVGPEGDFEEDELEKFRQKAEFLSLGKKILRFETAAFLALCLSGFINSRI